MPKKQQPSGEGWWVKPLDSPNDWTSNCTAKTKTWEPIANHPKKYFLFYE